MDLTLSAPAAVEAHPSWPLFGWVSDVRPAWARARDAGRPVALATLYRSLGPSPRPLASQMLIEADSMTGYLSGGCLEADVAAQGRATLADGRPRKLVYGVGSPFRDIRLPCGGRLEVLVERIAPTSGAADRLLELTERRTPALWRTDGESRACEAAEPSAPSVTVNDEPFGLAVRAAPATRLVVIGGDPIALAIAQLGVIQGLETWLVRTKGPPEPPFPGVRYARGDPAQSLSQIGLDPWTAVVAASHESEMDDAALVAALQGGAGYVGVLGARGRIPDRLDRLAAAGVEHGDLARLHAPIGLDIGARTPFEIAIAVHAEIIAALNGADRPR